MRAAIELLYKGKCSIYHKAEAFNPVTKRTTFEDVTICKDEPCRLSQSVGKGKQGENVANSEKVIKLFIRPELEVKAGAKAIVTQNGRTETFETAGIPAVYSSHQEIELIRKGLS